MKYSKLTHIILLKHVKDQHLCCYKFYEEVKLVKLFFLQKLDAVSLFPTEHYRITTLGLKSPVLQKFSGKKKIFRRK